MVPTHPQTFCGLWRPQPHDRTHDTCTCPTCRQRPQPPTNRGGPPRASAQADPRCRRALAVRNHPCSGVNFYSIPLYSAVSRCISRHPAVSRCIPHIPLYSAVFRCISLYPAVSPISPHIPSYLGTGYNEEYTPEHGCNLRSPTCRARRLLSRRSRRPPHRSSRGSHLEPTQGLDLLGQGLVSTSIPQA